ncbi:MAG TPA: hypothetical protein VMM76_09600 [Pirellulaceae bacterium]|nr:hypothetical protein [Pirellulaceae bacterium]
MSLSSCLWRTLLILFSVVCGIAGRAAGADAVTSLQHMRAALLVASDVTDERIEQLKAHGTTAVVVILQSDSKSSHLQERAAAARVQQSNVALYYWIEVARCPELADAHPEWMASLQGHSQWRRFFPDVPVPDDDHVVKTYPWVTILSAETYVAQLQRVRQVLADKPPPKGVFLNDLQGAPSACGCGNSLCRWTSDYGKRRTTTPLNNDAAARFVQAVQESVPNCPVLPVWTTECEEHDGAQDGLCAGVGCFKGICWKAYTNQLMPLAKICPQLAVLVPYREFQRDLPIYGERAGWIQHAVASFQSMPRRQGEDSIAPSRLITVLQGWDVDQADIAAQIRVATNSGCAGYIVAYSKIEQKWEPRIVKWRD